MSVCCTLHALQTTIAYSQLGKMHAFVHRPFFRSLNNEYFDSSADLTNSNLFIFVRTLAMIDHCVPSVHYQVTSHKAGVGGFRGQECAMSDCWIHLFPQDSQVVLNSVQILPRLRVIGLSYSVQVRNERTITVMIQWIDGHTNHETCDGIMLTAWLRHLCQQQRRKLSLLATRAERCVE
jgi:hypothetical protein